VRKLQSFGALLVLSVGLVGCSPSVQKIASVEPQKQTSVGVAGWTEVGGAVQRAAEAGRYKIKSSVDFQQGTIHTNYAVYGSVDAPDDASLSLHENNFNVEYYQQGQVAYAYDNGTWAQVPAIQDVDVFPSYIRVLSTVDQAATPIVQQPDVFVVDEFCHVFQATVPGRDVAGVALWGNSPVQPNIGAVQFTFYVGKSSHELREVDTASVGMEPGIGAILLHSNTVLFDLGSDIANVHIPNDLVKQLENKTN